MSCGFGPCGWLRCIKGFKQEFCTGTSRPQNCRAFMSWLGKINSTQYRQRSKIKWLAREMCWWCTGANSWAYVRTAQIFSSLWGFEPGQEGTYWITEQTKFVCELLAKQFLEKKVLSLVFLITTERQKCIYTHLIFTHCVHYENASFLLLDLV